MHLIISKCEHVLTQSFQAQQITKCYAMLGETARNPSAKCLEGLPEESLSLKKKEYDNTA